MQLHGRTLFRKNRCIEWSRDGSICINAGAYASGHYLLVAGPLASWLVEKQTIGVLHIGSTWLGILSFSVLYISFLCEHIYIGFTCRFYLNIFTSDSRVATTWTYLHRIHVSLLLEHIYIGFTFRYNLNIFTSDSYSVPVTHTTQRAFKLSSLSSYYWLCIAKYL